MSSESVVLGPCPCQECGALVWYWRSLGWSASPERHRPHVCGERTPIRELVIGMRDAGVLAYVRTGATYRDVGRAFGISKQRVGQIVRWARENRVAS